MKAIKEGMIVMALDFSAPKNGYDNPEKQKYRVDVWDCLIPAWNECCFDSRAHVLIMPSREGLEIDHLLSLGVPEDRIIAIDKSAAVIATSIWRKKFPKVKFFATTVGNCDEKLHKKGYVIAAANLDFCSNFCDEIVAEYRSFMIKAPKFQSSRVAVTIAKGREGKALVAMIKTFASRLCKYTEPRIAALMACSGFQSEHLIWGQGSYVSGRNPMAWAVTSQNYIKKKAVSEHIAQLKALDVEKCAAEVIKEYPKSAKKSQVEGWLLQNVADPFAKDLKKMMDGVLICGEKESIVSPHSELAQLFNYTVERIYRSNTLR
jgi:hypothetical protein